MKKLLSTFVVAVAALTFAACGQDSGPQTRTIRAGRPTTGAVNGLINPNGVQGAAGNGAPVPSNPQQVIPLGWGQINPMASANWDANGATKAFLSTDFLPNEVGNTAAPCTIGQALGGGNCAIMFTVTSQPNAVQYSPLTFQSGTLSSLWNTQGVPFAGTGFLTMIIWDSMSGTPTPDGSGNTFTPIPVVIPMLNQANGPSAPIQDSYGLSVYNGGGNISLVFGDSEGYVLLQGATNGNQFSGTISFNNAKNIAPGMAPASGQLGQFVIDVCTIIQCS